MLKILETKEEALELVEYLAGKSALSMFEVGLAGSFATGLNKKNSSIDIVLKLKDGENKSHIGSINTSAFIYRECAPVFYNTVQILWLDLLEKEELKTQNYVREAGLDNNPFSVYSNVVADTVWYQSEDTDSEDYEEDGE